MEIFLGIIMFGVIIVFFIFGSACKSTAQENICKEISGMRSDVLIHYYNSGGYNTLSRRGGCNTSVTWYKQKIAKRELRSRGLMKTKSPNVLMILFNLFSKWQEKRSKNKSNIKKRSMIREYSNKTLIVQLFLFISIFIVYDICIVDPILFKDGKDAFILFWQYIGVVLFILIILLVHLEIRRINISRFSIVIRYLFFCVLFFVPHMISILTLYHFIE